MNEDLKHEVEGVLSARPLTPHAIECQVVIRQLYALVQKQEAELTQLHLDAINRNISGVSYAGEDRFKGERQIKRQQEEV